MSEDELRLPHGLGTGTGSGLAAECAVRRVAAGTGQRDAEAARVHGLEGREEGSETETGRWWPRAAAMMMGLQCEDV